MTNGATPQDEAQFARRRQEAEVEKAEADAAKAEAEADKSRAEANKATADAAAAATAAAKADAELTNDRVTAPATNAKTIAEANGAAETARATAYSKLVPDLGAVKAGSLSVSDGPALWATQLSASALRKAASAVAKELTSAGAAESTVLVTTEVELASADALNLEVQQALTDLTTAAAALCTQIDTEVTAPQPTGQGAPGDGAVGQDQTATLAIDPVSAIGALAQLVPGALSLTSANRSVRTAAVSANDLAAVAAVCGGLVSHLKVVHDSFRLIPSAGSNGVFAAVTGLAGQRRELVARKISLGQQLSVDDSAVREANDALNSAQVALKSNTNAANRDALVTAVEKATAEVKDAKSAVARITSLGTLVESALSAIDALTADLHTVPNNALRSKLSSAALYEGLRTGATPRIDYVLLVRAEAGQTNQSVSDRALWLKDRVSVVVEAAVTYLMISTSDSTVIRAGTCVGVAQAAGVIGSRLEITA